MSWMSIAQTATDWEVWGRKAVATRLLPVGPKSTVLFLPEDNRTKM